MRNVQLEWVAFYIFGLLNVSHIFGVNRISLRSAVEIQQIPHSFPMSTTISNCNNDSATILYKTRTVL